MVITCTACSAKLSIPDKKIPKTGTVMITCPKCRQKVQIAGKRTEESAASALSAGALANVGRAPGLADDDDDLASRRLAMVCVDQLQGQMRVKTALAELGYTVHIVNDSSEAIDRLWQKAYDLVLLHEEFGGGVEKNVMLQTLQPMAMSIRRSMCIGLIGRQFSTFDQMTAFAKSVNFVVADQELGNLKAIIRMAAAEHEQFYRVYREILREAGKL